MEHYREHLRQKTKQLDLILSHIMAGALSRDQLVERILRSSARNPNVNDVEDYPLYKVCFWLSKHTPEYIKEKFPTRVELAKVISNDTKISLAIINNILTHEALKIPDNLKHSHRPYRRHIKEVEKEVIQTKSEINLPMGLEELTIKVGEVELTIKLTKKKLTSIP